MLTEKSRLLRKYGKERLQYGLFLTEYYFNQNGNCNAWGKRNAPLFSIKQSYCLDCGPLYYY